MKGNHPSPKGDSPENDYVEESESSTQESASQCFKRKATVDIPIHTMGHRKLIGKEQENAETLKRSKTGSKLDGQPKMAINTQIAPHAPYGYQSRPTQPQWPNPTPRVTFTPVNLTKNVKGTYHKDSKQENGAKQKDKTSQTAKEHQSSQKAANAPTAPQTPNTQPLLDASGQPVSKDKIHWLKHMSSQFCPNPCQWPKQTQHQFGASQPQLPHMQSQFGANQPQWPNPMPFPTSAQGTQTKASPMNDGRPPKSTKLKDQNHKLAEDKNDSNAQIAKETGNVQLPHDVADHAFPNAQTAPHFGANQPHWSNHAQVPAEVPHSSHSTPFPSGPPGMHVMGNGITINIGSFKNVFQFWDPRTIPEPSKTECKSPK